MTRGASDTRRRDAAGTRLGPTLAIQSRMPLDILSTCLRVANPQAFGRTAYSPDSMYDQVAIVDSGKWLQIPAAAFSGVHADASIAVGQG